MSSSSAAAHTPSALGAPPPSPLPSSSSTPTTTASVSALTGPSSTDKGPLRMQIIIRKDLDWPVGPLMAQASHAATAVLHFYREEESVKEYLEDLQGMRKLVYQTPTLDSLTAISSYLSSTTPPIKHYLWTEQPENIPTALAIIPNRSKGAEGKHVGKVLKKGECEFW
ncbi:peptidyl-tRNA hydrolase II domain-containing protein [Mrakia frigida]|uniref:peptidyl-tRNA hydrolase II domain-containing protein n=1 Tax=Mrakia frigida TaxID=29902 RepID=UPI003FCBFC4A